MVGEDVLTEDIKPTKEVLARWSYLKDRKKFFKGEDDYIRALSVARGYSRQLPYINCNIPELMANVNSALLFADTPLYTATDPANQKNYERIVKENNLNALLGNTARMTSGVGSAILKVSVNPTTPRGRKVPIVETIPEERCRLYFDNTTELVGLDYWGQVFPVDDEKLLLVVEVHRPGLIAYRAFESGRKSMEIGDEVDLHAYEATRHLPYIQYTGIDDLAARYIPNVTDADNPYGFPDTEGIEDEILAANDALRMAHQAAQLSLPIVLLDKSLQPGQGEKDLFRYDNKFMYVDKMSGELNDQKSIEKIDIGTDIAKYTDYSKNVYIKSLKSKGYSEELIGDGNIGGAYSGAALRLKFGPVLSIAARKAQLFEAALDDLLPIAALMDQKTYGNPETGIKEPREWADELSISVELNDGLPIDESEITKNVIAQVSAGIKSIETAISDINHDKEIEWQQEELERIEQEQTSQKEQAAEAARSSIPRIDEVISKISGTADEIDIS